MTREQQVARIRAIVRKVADAERMGGGFRLYFESAEAELLVIVDRMTIDQILQEAPGQVDRLLADLNDRAGFSLDDDVRSMIRPDWIKILGGERS